ncbi:MAG: LamG-like jellyroll fold domain-containing protein, partial [Limisphaerales bacterium]
MELNPQATAAMLGSPAGRALPLESRLLATLALEARSAARGLAQLMPELKRPLGDEEIRILTAQLGEPAVTDALTSALANPASRTSAVNALLKLRTSLDPAKLVPLLAAPARALLASTSQPDLALGAQLASEFQLTALEPDLAKVLEGGLAWTPRDGRNPKAVLQPQSLAALRALATLRSGHADLFAKLAGGGDPVVREAALAALAASKNAEAPARLLGLWPSLNHAERSLGAERLAATKPGAQALLASLRSGAIPRDEAGFAALENMHTLLPGDPQMEELWREIAGKFRRVLHLSGGNDDYLATRLTLAGPFTVEAWVKLAPNISNHDGILGAPGQLDMNFFASQFRVWIAGQHDIVVAKKKTSPEAWTHYAVTRDAQGLFRIFINGELDATGTARNTNVFTGLDVGRTTPAAGGTDGWLAEFRVWNTARTAEEIRDNFDRSFADSVERRPPARPEVNATRNAGSETGAPPIGLVTLFSGTNWGRLNGQARVEASTDSPALLTAGEAQAQSAKFAQFRTLAGRPGDAARGRELFTTICLACHQVASKGGQVAPPLDGVSHSGVEALLRNILTPSAAMEGGYRKFRVETRDDEIQEGLLVSEDPTAIVLRQPNLPDMRIPRANVRRAGFTNISMMPEGLLEAMKPGQVSDLFAFLSTLK